MRAIIAAMLLVVAIPLLTAAAETCQQSEICIYPGFAPEITPQTAHPATATTQTTTTSTTSTLPSTGTAQTGKATQTTATTTAKTTGTAQATRGFICPVTVSSSAEITSRINPARVHPGTGKVRPHNGLDIGKPLGTPVLAAAAGTVTTDRYEATGYGNYIIISHAGGMETRYAHLSSSGVREGDKVTQGQEIGKVGSTPGKPYSTGPHLHFELREGGKITKKPEDICVPGKTATAAKTGTGGKTRTAASTTPSICPKYDPLFEKYIAKNNAQNILTPAIVGGVSYTESGCRENPSNGQGMMQVVKCAKLGCSVEQNIDYGVQELSRNYRNIQSKGISNPKDIWTLLFFGYNRGMGTVNRAVTLNKGGKPLKESMVQACYEYYDRGSYGGCGGFNKQQCCDSPGLGAQYSDRIFANIPAAARPA